MSSPYLAAATDYMHRHFKGVSYIPKRQRHYRFMHCLRVASIGRQVAEAEGLNADTLEIACLLHDFGKFDSTRHVDHGRHGARKAREFLLSEGMPAEEVEEICQGIAMHCDGIWNDPEESPDYTGEPAYLNEPSVLARSVGDCDNIDRYGAYRIYDNLEYFKFDEHEIDEQLEYVVAYRQHLQEQYNYHCATETAQRMWIDALDFQSQFYERLEAQIRSSIQYKTHNYNTTPHY